MKLRNKRTEEIADLSEGFIKDANNGSMIQIKPVAISNKEGYFYNSLAELNKEWEDAPEETKEYFCVSCYCEGGIANFNKLKPESEIETFNKSIGNYFKTKEEAEKAVEKLKAWKELKDDGISYSLDECNGTPVILIHSKEERGSVQKVMRIIENLTLLFGGEDD